MGLTLRRWAGLLAGVLLLGLAHTAQSAQPPAEPMLRIEAGMHTAMIKRIATDAAGRYAVTASHDKTARVWEVATGRLLQVLRPPIGPDNEGKLNAVALSPDGSTVAVAGWTGHDWNQQAQIYLFERGSGQLIRRLGGLPNVINQLSFSADGRWLAAGLYSKSGLRVWDWRQGGAALADSAYGDTSYGAHWSPDGRLVTSSFDGKLRLYRVQPGALAKLAETKGPGGELPFGVAFSPNGRSVAVGYEDSTRVDVLEASSLAWQFSADTQAVRTGSLFNVAWSADGQTLVAGGRWQVNGRTMVRRWPQAGRGPAQDSPTAANTLMSLVPLPQGGWLLGAGGPSWGVVQADGRWQPLGTAPLADLRGSLDKAFLLDASGTQLQFGYELFGQASHWFDLKRRQLQAGSLSTGLAPRVTGMKIDDWINTTGPRLDGKRLILKPNEAARSLAIGPDAGSFVLGADFSLRLFGQDGQQRWEKAVPGTTWGVNIPSTGKLVVAAYGDGTIRWHRLSDGQEVLAFFPHADRKRWVLWSPSGYYDASPGAEELIGWHVNRGQDQAADFFPASRFRSKFYRPDVIDRLLDTLDEGEALRQADQAANRRQQEPVSVAQVLPPVVDVLSGAEISARSAEVTLKVKGRSAADAPVTGWRVRVNGQAVPDAKGLGRDQTERELLVPVPAQDSEIQVFAENRHGVSTPASVRVRWAGPAAAAVVEAAPVATGAAAGFQIQPRLYVLAIGVGAYQHKEISTLAFAAKDARDFAAAMQKQKGLLYREVELNVLTDDKASRDNIVDGLEWLQKQVTQHDVGMIFVSGHGVNDAVQGYTYLPVNADPDKLRRTGVAMDEFKKTLSSLPGKALFFFDTCHSGNVLGAKSKAVNDVSGVINELASAENGVVVFSSSTGRQLSYEDAAWGNGAFTKALVEGLAGGANYNKTGRITHKMLDLYISGRVKELTRGKQSPVTQAPGGVPDYPVAVVR